jgi:CheY-like chemotaxis protein
MGPEALMPIAVVLAVSLDSSFLGTQKTLWQSAGYFLTPARSIPEAIDRFKGGDFDLVLLDHSIPEESRERLTFLIRATGSSTPVVCIASPSADRDAFADATIDSEPNQLLKGIRELLANRGSAVGSRLAVMSKTQ